jgi:carbonic anhydrase
MSPLRPLLAALLLAHTVGAALAADWQLVLSDRNRRVEIDRSSILSSDAGTKISWGRVVLTSEEAKASGYAMIKALNRYDCRNRTFVTVKRVYVDADDIIVREEPVADQTPLALARNSVDERMWREVCNPPSAADLQKLASEAAKLAVTPAAAVAGSAAAPAGSKSATAASAAPVAVAPATTPAAAPIPPAKATAPARPSATRAQSGTVTPAPLAAARPEPAAPPELIRAGETPLPPPSVAQAAEPAIETHVEIPAKFLPGGAQAGESQTPRKSILPPLPGIATKTDAAPAQPTAPAPLTAAAAKPAPARNAAPAQVQAQAPVTTAPREEPPAKPLAKALATPPKAARAAPAQRAVSPTPSAPSATTSPPRRVARASVRADEGSRSSLPVATQPAVPAQNSAQANAIRVTRVPATEAGWSYEGDTGPQNWGKLRPEWRVCTEGTRQSPIDLRDGIAVELAPVQFAYGRTGFRIRDTGNTLQVDVGEGMGITVRGVRYALERFTLHRPSQDRVGGMAHDMAIYLEHRSVDGKQAILSVLLAAGGDAHTELQTLWNNLPLDRGREYTPDAVIDLAKLVPADPGHFLYTGSLPTPPCTEDVLWVVMKQPLPIADDQLAVFARLYPRNGRPIQPANGRPLLESR